MSLNNIGLFHLDNNRITILGTNEEPWFVAKEIGQLLGIINYHNVVAKLEDYQRGIHTMETHGGTQKVSIINESGLYEMIFNSRKEEAKKFKKWVFSEVLPSIRKKGKYELQRRNQIMNERLIESEIAIQDRENTITELEEKINNLQYIEEKHEDNPITIASRIIQLELLDQNIVDIILRDKIIDVDDRECFIEHPDKRKFISHLSKISRKLSTEKRNRFGSPPTISKRYRRNVYYERDYILYGDEIIRNYFLENQFHEWNIDLEWSFGM